jgi:hypothetical protein
MAVNKVKGLTLHEIFTKVAQAKTREDKINVLRSFNELFVRDVLKGAYDDTIQFIIPKGAPPYTPAPEENPPTHLRRVTKQFKYFVVGGPGENLQKLKVESMFIKALEAIHPDDAKIVLLMKDKELSGVYKGLTKKLASEAFPGLIAK